VRFGRRRRFRGKTLQRGRRIPPRLWPPGEHDGVSSTARTERETDKAILHSIFRPKPAALEDRVVPAVDWAKVAIGLAGNFATLGNSAAAFTDTARGDLPIIGAPMSARTARAR